jgi:hypothetical protein
MIFRRYLLSLLAVLTLSFTAHAQQYNAPEVSRSGVIEFVDMSANELIVEGNRYSMSSSAEVEIGGSYGAFTMLNSGMRIEFQYRRFDDGRREIFYVRELLSSESLEQA